MSLKKHPQEVAKWNRRWVDQENLWLNRTALLIQARWKSHTDQALLSANIDRHVGHNDLFIRKAIGWSLRELGERYPAAVQAFAISRKLRALSKREALKHLRAGSFPAVSIRVAASSLEWMVPSCRIVHGPGHAFTCTA